MSSSETPPIRLNIRNIDSFTEVRILDGDLVRVPLVANTGPIEIDIQPGIYEVGFRRDGSWKTQQIVVRPESGPVTVAPKDRTELFEVSTLANTVSEATKDAASVLVEFKTAEGLALDPATASLFGVELIGCNDDLLKPLYPQAISSGTWRFAAPPGRWRLRVTQPGAAPPLELALTVWPGWGLQLVAPLVVASGDDGATPRIDLDSLRVRMPPVHAMDQATQPDLISYEEAALSALTSARQLYGDHFDSLLDALFADKPQNAMLGLYAAYLCDDATRLGRMVDRLERLLGPAQPNGPFAAGHPDVRALRLKLSLAEGRPIDGEQPFPFPPLLARSWKILVEAARLRPELIPRGTLSERIADRLWPASLWLAWCGGRSAGIPHRDPPPGPRSVAPGAPTGETEPPPFEESRSLIVASLAQSVIRDWFRGARVRLEQDLEDVSQGVDWQGDALTPVEVSVGTALSTVAPSEENQLKYQRIALSYVHAAANDAESLAAQLGLPPAAIATAAASLAAKLLAQASLLNLERKVRTPMARPELIIPYDPAFLGDGFVVPMPTLSDSARAAALADGTVIDYTHYSLIMHRDRRTAMLTANNIDAARKVQVPGGLTWQMDERVGEYQLGRETYDDNQIDKGHLVRREDVLWGTVSEARLANKATFFYTNASPQHQNFNQDEWKYLEDWVLTRATDFSYRLCVFTGPVFSDGDPTLDDLPAHLRRLVPATGKARLPAAFWKVVILRDAEAGGDDLAAVAFAMKQNEMWDDKHGNRLLHLKVHQVTIEAIEEWTGLDFGPLKAVDELAFADDRVRAVEGAAEAPWPQVGKAEDIIWSGAARRARGIRALREANAPRALHSDGARSVTGGCRCEDEFDAETAIAALSRDVARLTDLVAGRETEPVPATPPAVPGARSVTLDAAPDPRVEEAASAAPEPLRDKVRAFARALADHGDQARGLKPVAEPRQLLRIVGGDIVPPGGFPHCVCIGNPSQWMCTGALVAPQVVLTAAHCGGSISRIAVGAQVMPWLSPDARVIAVRRSVVHPRYRAYPYSENDINIVILDAPALVPPVPIATTAEIGAASALELVGFGYNDPNKPVGFGTKRRVTLDIPPLVKTDPAADFSALEARYGFHSDYEFVGGRKALGKDSCNGDSGGPAYISVGGGFRLAGLTSRATAEAVNNCGDGGNYVQPIYFREWIDATVAAAGLAPLAWA